MKYETVLERNTHACGWWCGRDGKMPGPRQSKDDIFMQGWYAGLKARQENVQSKKVSKRDSAVLSRASLQ